MQEPYEQYGCLVTHSWMKMLWERLSRFDVIVTIGDNNLQFPWENDKFIMRVLIEKGYSGETLRRLNRVRVLQQALFMSDILTASGCKIDTEAMTRRCNGELRSSLRWPNEQPTDSDFVLWKTALQSICPAKCRANKVGKFIAETHRQWNWSWDESTSTLHRLHWSTSSEDVFCPGRKPNRFHFLHIRHLEKHSTVCLVEHTINEEHFRLTSVAPTALQVSTPSTFREVLMSWGNTWLWENLTITGGESWIHLSIADGMLVAVTDGSYTRELFPHTCSATFVLECSNGQGRISSSFTEVT